MLGGSGFEPGRKVSVAGYSEALEVSGLLMERDAADVVTKLEKTAIEAIAEENFAEAVGALKKSEEILEQMSTQGKAPDRDVVVCVLNNTACCYQKMGALEKCAAYLEACTIYTISLKSLSNKLAEVMETIKRAKQQCLIHVQLCAVLSQLGNHDSALEKAKSSVRLAHFCIDASLHAAKLHHSRYQQTISKVESVSDTLEQTHTMVKRAVYLLKCVQDLLRSPQASHNPEQQIRSTLGVKSYAEWVYELSISDVMFIEPIVVAEMKAKNSVKGEFSKDFLLDKVANVAVGYFCVSTEMQFLRGKQAFNPDRDQEAESLHKKSLQLLETFFPSECPLRQHIAQTYEKRYISDLHEIPEESAQLPHKSRSKSSRNHSKTPSQDVVHTGKLPILRTKPLPKTPSTIPRKETSRPKVQRKASMEVRSTDSEKTKSEANFAMYSSRRVTGKRIQNRSFDRERRNKSAELVRGEATHLEEYLIGVMEGRTQSPASQFIVS